MAAVAPEPSRGGRIARELAALGFVAAAAWAMLSLGSREFGGVNLGGSLGGALAASLAASFGIEAYLVIAAAAALGWRAWAANDSHQLAHECLGALLLLAAISAIGGFLDRPGAPIAGSAGVFFATELKNYLNFGGGAIAVMVAIAIGLALTLHRAPTDLLAFFGSQNRVDSNGMASDGSTPSTASTGAASGQSISIATSALASPDNSDAAPPKLKFAARQAPKSVSSKTEGLSGATTSVAPRRGAGGFQLPPLDLLDTPSGEHAAIDEIALAESARAVEQKLGDFGVAGRVVEVQPGPVVTMYKFEPGSGVKVSQIVNLADDLSLALRAPTVRIQAPVPGEAVVGIEVPNRKREKVYLREILEADEFRAARSQLTIALGKDIAGRPAAADLAAMPHLLIAGATGTGKSVSIHTMIASILFNATADDVRFILIDPKMLELSVYDAIPHLLVPVVVDPEKPPPRSCGRRRRWSRATG